MPNEDLLQTEQSLPSTNEPQVKDEKTQSKKSSCFGLNRSILSLVIMLVLIFSTMYLSLFNLQQSRIIQKQMQEVLDVVTLLKTKQLDYSGAVRDKFRKIYSKQALYEGQLKSLNQRLETNTQEPTRLALLKASYYLDLAKINASWSDDLQTTAKLLEAASTLLINISQPELIPVKQALTKEIMQLKILSRENVYVVLNQINAVQNLLSDLPVKSLPSQIKKDTADAIVTTNTQGWHAQLSKSLNALKNLVVIRRNDDEKASFLLSPFYKTLVYESIQLDLQEAQWAVLQRNPEVYQLALRHATANINRSFEKTSPKTQSFLERVHALQQKTFFKKQPIIGGAELLLNEFIKSTSSVDEQRS